MDVLLTALGKLPLIAKLAVFVAVVVVTHLTVIGVRRIVSAYFRNAPIARYRKLRTVATLTASAIIFTLYFLAFGLILKEFGVSLTAYLASASVLGLAIGFGSQGFVQDIVNGLTFIFSDLVDVGDLVEISGQTGIVKGITLRFVQLENALGASVFIPNRTISNVINYPRGYVRCIVDVTLCGDDATKTAIENIAMKLAPAVHEQYPGILITEPSIEGRVVMTSGKEILRLKFRIWPNRGQPIENSFCQELIAEAKKIHGDYAPWMVSISYEVERKHM